MAGSNRGSDGRPVVDTDVRWPIQKRKLHRATIGDADDDPDCAADGTTGGAADGTTGGAAALAVADARADERDTHADADADGEADGASVALADMDADVCAIGAVAVGGAIGIADGRPEELRARLVEV